MMKFASEDFQKISEKNKKNRSKNLVPPTVGTRSLARRVDESRREGKEVSEIKQYKMAHYSKKLNGMINEEVDTIWNDLQAEEATSSCTSAEICLKKLGHLPGHIKGRSASTKQILETVNLRSELKALKEENKATNEKVDYLLEEMKKMAQLLQQFQTREGSIFGHDATTTGLPGKQQSPPRKANRYSNGRAPLDITRRQIRGANNGARILVLKTGSPERAFELKPKKTAH
ncbi:reverse transcriptase domain-containing protein [Tanacetum coccineum]